MEPSGLEEAREFFGTARSLYASRLKIRLAVSTLQEAMAGTNVRIMKDELTEFADCPCPPGAVKSA